VLTWAQSRVVSVPRARSAPLAARHDVPPSWDDAEQCARCSAGFGMLRRRTHCRNCGYSMCKSCTKFWPKAAFPPAFTDGDSSSSCRVCLSCDAAAMALRAALLSGDIDAAKVAYMDGRANVNLRCCVPPTGENGASLLLPVHLAAAADSLPALKWLAVEEHCAIVGANSLSLGKPAKSVLRVAIESQAVDCMQWLVAADDAPPHVGLPVAMPPESGCAPAAVHRALDAALQDGYRQRVLVQLTIEQALAQGGEQAAGGDAPTPLQPSRDGSREARRYPRPVEDPAEDDPNNECVICLAAPKECVLLECRHACVCEQCGNTLAQCPLCRANIERVVRIFQ
jgi:hypothetical protein